MTEIEMRGEARKRLESLKDIQLEKVVIQERIQKLMLSMEPAGLPSATVFERLGGGSTLPTLTQLKELTRLREQLDDWHNKAVNLELEILAEIHKLEHPKRRALLISKYVNGNVLGNIAFSWGYSTENIKYIHRMALLEFYNKNLKI